MNQTAESCIVVNGFDSLACKEVACADACGASCPVVYNRFNGSAEVSLSNSCKNALKHLAKDKRRLIFEKADVDLSGARFDNPALSLPVQVAGDSRNLIISFIQDNRLPLIANLTISALFLNGMDTALNGMHPRKDISARIKLFANFENRVGFMSSLVDTAVTDTVMQAAVIDGLITCMKTTFCSADISEKHPDFRSRVEAMKENYDSLDFRAVTEGKEQFLRSFLAENTILAENYLVLDIFNSMFPSMVESFETAARVLLLRYLILQIFICLVFAGEKSIATDGFYDCAYVLSRISPFPDFCRSISGFIKDNKGLSIGVLACILQ